MVKTPQIETMTEFRANYKATLDKLVNGPVFLLQHSDVAAVLLSRNEYDALLERIEELEDIAAVREYEQRKATGNVSYRTLSTAEIAEWAGDEIPIEGTPLLVYTLPGSSQLPGRGKVQVRTS